MEVGVGVSNGACAAATAAEADLIKEEEPDVVETNCKWAGCGIEFHTQDQLVKVSH